MLSEAPASTPNRLSRSGSSAARCLTVDSRRESANLLRRLSCCVRQSLRLPMREMQRSFHSPLRQPCRIAREPATTLQSALTLQSSGTRLSLRSFLTPHFHVLPLCRADKIRRLRCRHPAVAEELPVLHRHHAQLLVFVRVARRPCREIGR